jgi:hypothetical protein
MRHQAEARMMWTAFPASVSLQNSKEPQVPSIMPGMGGSYLTRSSLPMPALGQGGVQAGDAARAAEATAGRAANAVPRWFSSWPSRACRRGRMPEMYPLND